MFSQLLCSLTHESLARQTEMLLEPKEIFSQQVSQGSADKLKSNMKRGAPDEVFRGGEEDTSGRWGDAGPRAPRRNEGAKRARRDYSGFGYAPIRRLDRKNEIIITERKLRTSMVQNAC